MTNPDSQPVESAPLTTTPLQKRKEAPNHPKGHRVHELQEVWDTMDKNSFLHLTDTLLLADVWVQPISVEETTGLYTVVTFMEIVLAPNIKRREATTKMAVDEVLQMLFLTDTLINKIKGVEPFLFDDWLAEKTAEFIKKNGVGDSTNRSKLCNFILKDDKEFSFYPRFVHDIGIFFRKIGCHSYKDPTTDKEHKMKNPSMIKCRAARAKFEYMIEARLVPIPSGWWETADVSLPETQPF